MERLGSELAAERRARQRAEQQRQQLEARLQAEEERRAALTEEQGTAGQAEEQLQQLQQLQRLQAQLRAQQQEIDEARRAAADADAARGPLSEP